MSKRQKPAQERIHFSVPGLSELGGDGVRHHEALSKVFGPFPISLNWAADYDALCGMAATEPGEGGVYARILDHLDKNEALVLHLTQ